jgi:hypothetical protein
MAEGSGQVDFKGLVAGLAASALVVLQQVEALLSPGAASEEGQQGQAISAEERAKRVSEGMSGARQLIDTLAVLEAKTKGNLDAGEQELLQGALAELRLVYVRLSNRPGAGEGAGQRGGK